MVAIKQQLVSRLTVTNGVGNPCNFITIHETANKNKGAGAQVHANLQTNGYSASWHYQVDDKEIIQSYPDDVRCWHAGDGNGPGNQQSIGIEICVNPDSDFKKAVANAAALVKILMARHNIPLTNVVQHNRWSGKNCPTNLRNGSKGINWVGFINLIDSKVVEDKPLAVAPPKTESGPVQSITKPAQSTASKTGGIVDWMNANKMDSSYTNRAKLAAQHGIKGYTGTATQNNTLLNKLKGGAVVSKPKGDRKTTSVVDYLKSIGQDSSYANRSKLADKNGIKNYTGTSSQNSKLLKKIRG